MHCLHGNEVNRSAYPDGISLQLDQIVAQALAGSQWSGYGDSEHTTVFSALLLWAIYHLSLASCAKKLTHMRALMWLQV